jgi:hypothetical protein
LALEPELAAAFYAELQSAEMPPVPAEFSVVPQHQVISRQILAEISEFIGIFDRVTARAAWQSAALHDAPAIAQPTRNEVCFFSAWDFHLPAKGGWQLIEFNDNGSGFLFAAIINALYYAAARLARDEMIAAPVNVSAFGGHIADIIEQEAQAFFGKLPADLFLILDDAPSLRQGRFRKELQLLCRLLQQRGWRAAIGYPEETRWDGHRLLFGEEAVSFIVNRSTDFFWHAGGFAAIRSAYLEYAIYVAPNPFTYACRSDKGILEWLSLPDWDKELAIEMGERQILSAHVPETHRLRSQKLAELVQRKHEFIFKPLHGFAGHGLLGGAEVGEARLRRLLKQHKGYVAQRIVPKPSVEIGGIPVWRDLRVWAYRGEIFHLSGRASRQRDRLDLTPPGGWVPTYTSV